MSPRAEAAHGGSRFDLVRRRARAVKIAAGLAAASVFGASMLLSRVTYAGHSKRPIRPLTVPPRFYSVVRQNLLQAGIMAPAKAPPDVVTSSS